MADAFAGCGSSPPTWGTRGSEPARRLVARFIPTDVGNATPSLVFSLLNAVHPHRRGERAVDEVDVVAGIGSSPPTWGTRAPRRARPARARFIPTDVGNALGGRRAARPSAVHPHRRGERGHLLSTHRRRRGSSPPTWGTRLPRRKRGRRVRFIPTDVGNARRRSGRSAPDTVHPHRRGERLGTVSGRWRRGGSSPPTWGTRRADARPHRLDRFIPTDVGNAREQGAASSPASGSSPPTWGTRARDIDCSGRLPVHPHRRGERVPRTTDRDHDHRFIPTDVGNACCAAPRRSQPSVHPHRRGERTAGGGIDRLHVGSSPPTWGTPVRREADGVLDRFIPTDVGNATTASSTSMLRSVHPHRRGERSCISRPRQSKPGSSPPTWGTLVRRAVADERSRFIPTDVGNAETVQVLGHDDPVHPHRRGERTGVPNNTAAPVGSSPPTWGTRRGR